MHAARRLGRQHTCALQACRPCKGGVHSRQTAPRQPAHLRCCGKPLSGGHGGAGHPLAGSCPILIVVALVPISRACCLHLLLPSLPCAISLWGASRADGPDGPPTTALVLAATRVRVKQTLLLLLLLRPQRRPRGPYLPRCRAVALVSTPLLLCRGRLGCARLARRLGICRRRCLGLRVLLGRLAVRRQLLRALL